MSNYSQPQAYPPPGTAYPAEAQGGYTAPKAAAADYPGKDGQQGQIPPGETQSRGDGFWRGCCAGMCCWCLLDACF